jgi:hypothetical protein
MPKLNRVKPIIIINAKLNVGKTIIVIKKEPEKVISPPKSFKIRFPNILSISYFLDLVKVFSQFFF